VESLCAVALTALDAGLSVVPPREDGSKAPIGAWHAYQSHRATRAQVERWYTVEQHAGIGLVCGAVSGGKIGGLECLEFEDALTYDAFKEAGDGLGYGPLIAHIERG
jgi:Bifunctional DNA primase/polymerase, N-terminal